MSLLGEIFRGVFKDMGTITINGQSYTGRNISINGDVVVIDGVVQEGSLVGPVSVVVLGSAEEVKTVSGEIHVQGSVCIVKSTSGDISCWDVLGDVQTVSGDIECRKVTGNINTVSGDVDRSL